MAQPSFQLASASVGGDGVRDGGAAVLQPGSSIRRRTVAEQSSDLAAEASSENQPDGDGDGDRWQDGERRVQLEEDDLGGEQSSNGGPFLPLAGSANPKSDLSEVPDSTLSAEAVAERIAAMFVVGASGPQASGLPTLAPDANRKIVKLGSAAINDRKLLPKERVDELSKSFGNFDRVVGLGWLLGDAVLGPPLLSRQQAYDVGLKARREAGYIEKAEKKLKNDASREKSKMLGQSERDDLDERLRAYMLGQAAAGVGRRRPAGLVACCTARADGLEEAGAACGGTHRGRAHRRRGGRRPRSGEGGEEVDDARGAGRGEVGRRVRLREVQRRAARILSHPVSPAA